MTRDPSISVFVILNLVLSGLAAIATCGMGGVLYYGVVHSGDTGDELMSGIVGSVLIGGMMLAGTLVYLFAGLGLRKRRRWGYQLHLVGAALAVPSCVGIIYTVFAITYARRPSFRDEFFDDAPAGGFAPLMNASPPPGGTDPARRTGPWPPTSQR